jgi:hypothetical protein
MIKSLCYENIDSQANHTIKYEILALVFQKEGEGILIG